MTSTDRSPLREIAGRFFRLGLIAFGGPAAHIAMMDDEFVERRGWISRQHFLDLVGATNLIPGPNSTEMTMHIGYERGRLPGLIVAGACFIAPATVITLVLAWLYVEYGRLPQAGPLLAGIKPAVIAIILAAVWKLGLKAVKGWAHAVLGAVTLAVVLVGADPLVVLLPGGVAGALWLYLAGRLPELIRRRLPPAALLLALPGAGLKAAMAALSIPAQIAPAAAEVSLWRLGLAFLKIGAVLYGSGYVLFAFLERDLVQGLGWLTQAQLIDAIAIGQFTPGPVLSTATFIGYLIAGVPGALVATVGIFLPSFVFVLLLNPLVPRLRERAVTAFFLDAVNVAALALMAAVTLELGRETLTTWQSWLILGLAAVLTLRFRVNAAWIVVGGAVLGYLLF